MPDEKVTVTNINPPMPIINLNGTDGTTLLSEWVIARNAVDAALKEVASATLHGRDFQTHPLKTAYNLAVAHHAKRLRMLVLVRDEIEAICINLQNQLHEREDRSFHERQANPSGLKLRKGETVVVSADPEMVCIRCGTSSFTDQGQCINCGRYDKSPAPVPAWRPPESDDNDRSDDPPNMRETLLGIVAVCDMADATRNETTTVDGLLKTIRNIGSMASDTLKAQLLKDGE